MEFTNRDLLLNDDDLELEYRRRKDEEKTSIAYGQRKLLLAVVQFLTDYCDFKKCANPVVVYIGSAPGTNIGIISLLFPEVVFHLYDPKPIKLKENDKIKIYQQFFTDKDAQYWKENNKNNIYFISDIRTADYTKAKDLDENEMEIMEDMKKQLEWYEIIKPLHAHLKFRLPYTGGNRPEFVDYLDGILYKGCWTGQTSTETRLVPNGNMKKWSCLKYQSQLFHHNVVIREKNKYINPFTGNINYIDDPELTNDWDSRCETEIWINYLKFRNTDISNQNIIMLSRLATIKLSRGRKNDDKLSYLRANPRAIKERNFNPQNTNNYKKNQHNNDIKKYMKWINTILPVH